jgi:hypothetical protein
LEALTSTDLQLGVDATLDWDEEQPPITRRIPIDGSRPTMP